MRIINILIIYIFCINAIYSANEHLGFNHILEQRSKINMVILKRDSRLDKASENHSIYLNRHNLGGHIEKDSLSGFTGKMPQDRAVKAGYNTTFIGENISTNQVDFKTSVDDLFTALYHRLGFLDVEFDALGLHNEGKAYTYMMSNSLLDKACKDKDKDLSGYLICADKKKSFNQKTLDDTKGVIGKKNPPFVIWPPNQSKDNIPYFYYESPDPLPDYDVSGNPVSISFNKYYHKEVKLIKFELLDSNGGNVSVILKNKSNDIHKILDGLSFALFPTQRLKWGETYSIKYEFKSLKTVIKGVSSFSTKSLPKKSHTVIYKKAIVKVVSGEMYLIDLKPLNQKDDTIGKYSYTKSSSAMSVTHFKVKTPNTFEITLDGKVGNSVLYKFNSREVTIEIKEKDSEEDGISMKYTSGWNLSALPGVNSIRQLTQYFGDYNFIFTYKDGKFIDNPSSINHGDAFFIHYSRDTITKKISGKEYPPMSNFEKGWSLIPIGIEIKTPQQYFSTKHIYILKQGKYERTNDTLNRGNGIWIYL